MDSLRERKKLKAKNAMQLVALRLFKKQGYGATTVEQIAAVAEVSPSTFFRYFPTKESVVLHDSLDPLIIDAFRTQPAGLSVVSAMRESLRQVLDGLPPEKVALERVRSTLIHTVPELQARFVDELVRSLSLFQEIIAERSGLDAEDITVVTLAGAIIGVIMSAYFQAAKESQVDDMGTVDAALAQLESGLPHL